MPDPVAEDEGRAGPPDGGHPHVLVDDVDHPALDGDTGHHLSRVRRLRDGDAITVTDGAGRWRWATFRGERDPEPSSAVYSVDRHLPLVGVAFALTKGHKPDWTVQKLAELGIDRIIPFRAERSIVRWDDRKTAEQHNRMTAIVRGAVEQSRQCFVPRVEPVATVDDLVTLGAVRLDRDGPPLSEVDRVVAIGPEGGWAESEQKLLTERASLGRMTLRSETAALTAGVLLHSLRSGNWCAATQKDDGA